MSVPAIEKREIIEQQLFPHYTGQGAYNDYSNAGDGSIIIPPIVREAGETITEGWAIAVSASDDKVYIADIQQVNQLPAYAIAGNSGVSGEDIIIIQEGVKFLDGVVFSIASPAWLCSPTLGSPNVSTVKPVMTSGYWCQRLGLAVETDKYAVCIEIARKIQ